MRQRRAGADFPLFLRPCRNVRRRPLGRTRPGRGRQPGGSEGSQFPGRRRLASRSIWVLRGRSGACQPALNGCASAGRVLANRSSSTAVRMRGSGNAGPWRTDLAMFRLLINSESSRRCLRVMRPLGLEQEAAPWRLSGSDRPRSWPRARTSDRHQAGKAVRSTCRRRARPALWR
jgi:hypothetical protein